MNIGALLGQFGPMFNMLRGGGGNPMAMIQQMTGGNSNSPLAQAFKQAQQAAQGRNAGDLESFVKQEFQKAGLDIHEVRRTLGI